MTEAEARAALRAFGAASSSEACVAAMPWEPTPDGGWAVLGDILGRTFRLARAPAGLRVEERHTDGLEVSWVVPMAFECCRAASVAGDTGASILPVFPLRRAASRILSISMTGGPSPRKARLTISGVTEAFWPA